MLSSQLLHLNKAAIKSADEERRVDSKDVIDSASAAGSEAKADDEAAAKAELTSEGYDSPEADANLLVSVAESKVMDEDEASEPGESGGMPTDPIETAARGDGFTEVGLLTTFKIGNLNVVRGNNSMQNRQKKSI